MQSGLNGDEHLYLLVQLTHAGVCIIIDICPLGARRHKAKKRVSASLFCSGTGNTYPIMASCYYRVQLHVHAYILALGYMQLLFAAVH